MDVCENCEAQNMVTGSSIITLICNLGCCNIIFTSHLDCCVMTAYQSVLISQVAQESQKKKMAQAFVIPLFQLFVLIFQNEQVHQQNSQVLQVHMCPDQRCDGHFVCVSVVWRRKKHKAFKDRETLQDELLSVTRMSSVFILVPAGPCPLSVFATDERRY